MLRSLPILCLLAMAAAAYGEPLSYTRDIRPLLSKNCFACHGPDDEKRKAKTRLDVPGAADLDEVVARITSTDPDEQMPPPEANKNLTDDQVDLLKRWISEGARYEQHWAFVPPRRSPVPADKHPVDHFIEQRLKSEKRGLAPAANPITLIRRVYLDLIGLPPTPEEADAFAANPSEEAYQAIVDQLLSSPRYGERWARRWLDLARYADTNGYEKDRDRSIWPYRDWVIRAINKDMPFDQFTVEQLAGDMLPDAGSDQIVATGFHRNTMLNEEGGIDPLEFRFHAMTDRVATTGTTWLGLTTGCAQCHTHKYDPITHRDYFGMMAYLNNADEPDYLIRDTDKTPSTTAQTKEIERLIAELPEKWPVVPGAFHFENAPPIKVATEGLSAAEFTPDGTVIIKGPAPDKDTYTVTIETQREGIAALRLKTLTGAGKGPGRTDHGNFVLSEIEITASPMKGEGKPKNVVITSAAAEVEQPTYTVAQAIDGKTSGGGWGIHDPARPMNRDRAATFTFAEPLGYRGGTRLTVKLIQNLGTRHTIGKFQMALGTPSKKSSNPSRAEALEIAYQEWIAETRPKVVDWQTLEPREMKANFPYLVSEGDGIIFAGGDTSKHDIYTLSFPASNRPVRSLRLEALPDERLPDRGPGTTFYEGRKGDFYLTEFLVRDEGSARPVAKATETYAKNRFGNNPVSAALATDGDIQTGWSVSGAIGQRHVAVFTLEKPIPAGRSFEIEMHFGRHYASSLGKFRLSAASVPSEASTMASDLAALLSKKSLTPAESRKVKSAFLMQAAPLKAFTDHIRKLQEPASGTPTLVMKERPTEHPRPTFRHHRGEYTQPKEEVAPRLPAALYPDDSPPPKDRLGFARWLVSPENPLTARVVANRHWAALFGTGIVRTLDDFGMQGELPSHPELLDFFAIYLVDQKWSIKKLHRLLVTSATYRQASRTDLPGAHFRLLDLFPRTRLDAEIIRDSALVAAGILNEKMHGPPVRPPQPSGVTEAAYGRPKWNASSGADRHRRSIYTYQKRTAPFAMFTTFDAGSGEACIARRDVSNTPMQALTLMNDPMFIEIAEALGKRIAATGGDTRAKIIRAFRWVLTRSPSSEELRLLSAFHAKHQSWPALARALLSLDESITKN